MTLRKKERVDDPHVRALNDLARSLRVDALTAGPTAERFVPWFDPDSGGVGARVLVLMESPGPRTVRAGDLGFSSEDNDDPTAAALRHARERSGLTRSAYLRWNVVPWPLYDEAGSRRPPTMVDLDDARPALSALLGLLPDLEVVVTVGAPALNGIMRLITSEPVDLARTPRVLGVPHPSPRNARQRTEARERLEHALASAVRDDSPSGPN
ncbi:uracil-DNA glycosylase [Nocardioides lianchengensis]|uniref:Uracil-DNA glycosylase n=1 Tax=Nocardioides lianchengensis TaxID=1045774 RepID=A0A1G6UQU0_9ACTN|nr:uracil-DNA glycosylase [Nocardioides lianchengensis]NYG11011.1 uracil-DNA glycosylase [Nocardioides lianchengensis]SDD43758.1 Uracil-DNA glycosylase [Nocardioides lianchengensis]